MKYIKPCLCTDTAIYYALGVKRFIIRKMLLLFNFVVRISLNETDYNLYMYNHRYIYFKKTQC